MKLQAESDPSDHKLKTSCMSQDLQVETLVDSGSYSSP